MNRFGIIVLAAMSLAGAAGCASTPAAPEVMRDSGADFGGYRTFGWFQPPQDDKASPTRSIVDGYVRIAIANEMKAKGYTEAAEGATPDLTIEYAAASSDKLKNNPFRIGVGVGSYGSNVGGSVGVGVDEAVVQAAVAELMRDFPARGAPP
jgi:hypothetical protein